MADTKRTPEDEPNPATEPETADAEATPSAPATDAQADAEASKADASKPDASKPDASKPDASKPDASKADASKADASEAEASDAAADDDSADASTDDDAADEATDEQPVEQTDKKVGKDATETEATTATETGIDADDDASALPYPTRVGWVVAAFLLFWPLAIPALVLSMRTAEANGTGNARRAKKSSVRTLDLALGGIAVGVIGIVGLVVGVAAAPAYASSLPQGFVAAARSFVPPALAGPLGITQPDDAPELAAPSSAATPTDDPYMTDDPYAPVEPGADPYPDTETSADESDTSTTPDDADDRVDGAAPQADATATAGAEIPDLAVGDCIDTAATSGQSTLYRIPVVSCTTAHGGEIYAETTAPDSLAADGKTPTQKALWEEADAYCYPQFAKFVGTRWAKSELLYWPIAPSEESWADGDRRILCVVEAEQPVTGSLKGTAR